MFVPLNRLNMGISRIWIPIKYSKKSDEDAAFHFGGFYSSYPIRPFLIKYLFVKSGSKVHNLK